LRPSLHLDRPWPRILWHPDEGLWNWDLLDVFRRFLPVRPVYKLAAAAIVLVDTLVLAGRAVGRRIDRLGWGSLFRRARLPAGVSVLWLDLGTHEEARELLHAVDRFLPGLGGDFHAFGFEASPAVFEKARRRVAGRDRVTLRNAALCGDLPAGGRVRLFGDGTTGLGNSLYRRGGAYEDVEALRLSDWIRDTGLDLERNVVLLRMNIEGAEYDVIRDLLDSGVAGAIDGWFGMWDDVSKIDGARGTEFRELLARAGIAPFTFNGRDFLFPPRLKCIEYDLGTAILAAVRRRARPAA